MAVKAQMFIWVMDRGFVLVGRPREQRPGDDYLALTLDDCATVRRWGTTRGLGQLAAEGPQPTSVLDPEPDGTQISRHYLLRRIPCTSRAWDSWTPKG